MSNYSNEYLNLDKIRLEANVIFEHCCDVFILYALYLV